MPRKKGKPKDPAQEGQQSQQPAAQGQQQQRPQQGSQQQSAQQGQRQQQQRPQQGRQEQSDPQGQQQPAWQQQRPQQVRQQQSAPQGQQQSAWQQQRPQQGRQEQSASQGQQQPAWQQQRPQQGRQVQSAPQGQQQPAWQQQRPQQGQQQQRPQQGQQQQRPQQGQQQQRPQQGQQQQRPQLEQQQQRPQQGQQQPAWQQQRPQQGQQPPALQQQRPQQGQHQPVLQQQQRPQQGQQQPALQQQHPQQGPQQSQTSNKKRQQTSNPQQKPSGVPVEAGAGDASKNRNISTNVTGITGQLKNLEMVQSTPGKKGRIIKIETNHFPLNLGKLKNAYHYDVVLIPDKPKKFLRNVMEKCRQKYYPTRYPAFDGNKNLFSSTLLDFGTLLTDAEIKYQTPDGREMIFKIEIKFVKEVDLKPLHNYELSRVTPQDALQVIDIVLRSAPVSSLISGGRNFYMKPQEIIDLGEGMELYHGFYQSAIRGWKPFLNVDVAHKAFPKAINVTDALQDVLSNYRNRFTRENLANPLDRYNEETFKKYIKTLRVIYEIPNMPSSKRAYRVNGLGEPACEKRFQLEDGQSMTIEQYFATQKRYKLKYPKLPTLWVGDVNRKDKILLPMELCRIEAGQYVNRKTTENQTATMIKYAATSTTVRKEKIIRSMADARFNDHPTVREFGISVSHEFEKLDARLLEPPTIDYKDRPATVSKGVWRNNKFYNGVEITNWTIVAADRRLPRNDELVRLENELKNAARQNGLTFHKDAVKPFISIGDRLHDIKQNFIKLKNKGEGYDVIFVVVPNNGPQYSYVKTAAEINVGCLTQCIKSRTLGRMNAQTATNILLKVNAKLNGTNHYLKTRPTIMNRPTMIMGADVTHPSPDAKDIPSVAAVTASHDPKAFQYNICWRLQSAKQEIIDDLQNIVTEHLEYFHKKTNLKPERIIFFRDGVSEGQFDQVRDFEIRAIRAACKRMQPDGYEPAITFLVVQKRHHTRFFPLHQNDSHDRNFNVPAGTCVDNQITHPFMQDFYLVSHASIQGVAKPTKYCSLWDDNNMSNDDVEELTYFLCHMFTRCNRSVSYPAPTYYAHLAAARAKVYIENERLDMNNLQREYLKFQIMDEIRKKRPMFFV